MHPSTGPGMRSGMRPCTCNARTMACTVHGRWHTRCTDNGRKLARAIKGRWHVQFTDGGMRPSTGDGRCHGMHGGTHPCMRPCMDGARVLRGSKHLGMRSGTCPCMCDARMVARVLAYAVEGGSGMRGGMGRARILACAKAPILACVLAWTVHASWHASYVVASILACVVAPVLVCAMHGWRHARRHAS